jgi:hypothetical protein
MTTYAIDDGNGNQLTTGVQLRGEAQRIAQRKANERGEVVAVYTLEGSEDSTGEWQPEESWTVEPEVQS